jgi:PemK-like protein.
MVIIVPITSKDKGISSYVELVCDFLTEKSFIKTEDICSIFTNRLIKRLGRADNETMKFVEERIKMLLGFI